MTVFEAVRQISCNDAAERLGLKGRRTGADKGMWCCPFHEDKTPSMACFERDNRFYCFSCHTSGDAADLFAKVRGLSLGEAARAALQEFGLDIPGGCDRPRSQPVTVRRDLVQRVARLVRYDFREAMVLLLTAQADGMTTAMDKAPDTEGWLWAHALQRACRVQEEAARWQDMTDEDVASEIRVRLASGEKATWGEGLPTPGRTLFRAMLDDLERLARIPNLNLQELEATLDELTMVGPQQDADPPAPSPSPGTFLVGRHTK